MSENKDCPRVQRTRFYIRYGRIEAGTESFPEEEGRLGGKGLLGGRAHDEPPSGQEGAEADMDGADLVQRTSNIGQVLFGLLFYGHF